MDFFNELGKTFEGVARQVEEKSSELWEAGKLNLEIFKQEDAIRRVYRKIGEQIYSEYEKGKEFGGPVNQSCDEIKDRKQKITELKSKLNDSRKAEKRHGSSPQKENNSNTAHMEKEETAGTEAEKSHPEEPEISYYEAVENMKKMQDE